MSAISYPSLATALSRWGARLGRMRSGPTWQEFAGHTYGLNPWFEATMLDHALQAWSKALDLDQVSMWLDAWAEAEKAHSVATRPTPVKVGLVLPGNIPLAGLHDVLSVLVAGHLAVVKPSSEDAGLVQWAVNLLLQEIPEWSERVTWVDRLVGVDAVVATGSDSSLPYFEQYFGHLPHLFRRNRTATALVWGHESADDWAALAHDVFLYYGKGCRNVSRLLLPSSMAPEQVLEPLSKYFKGEGLHHRYRQNLDYQIAMQMLDKKPYWHNGSLVLRPNPEPASPVGVLHCATYENPQELAALILPYLSQTQCIATKMPNNPLTQDPRWRQGFTEAQWEEIQRLWVGLGQCQHPRLWDYADGVNLVTWLSGPL